MADRIGSDPLHERPPSREHGRTGRRSTMLYCRTVPTGWIAIFRGGLELEVRTDLENPMAFWSTTGGTPLGVARWGKA